MLSLRLHEIIPKSPEKHSSHRQRLASGHAWGLGKRWEAAASRAGDSRGQQGTMARDWRDRQGTAGDSSDGQELAAAGRGQHGQQGTAVMGRGQQGTAAGCRGQQTAVTGRGQQRTAAAAAGTAEGSQSPVIDLPHFFPWVTCALPACPSLLPTERSGPRESPARLALPTQKPDSEH